MSVTDDVDNDPSKLTRRERVDLAVGHYGLYLIGMATTDSERIDEDCCMTNCGVPYWREDLTTKQRLFLTDCAAAQGC